MKLCTVEPIKANAIIKGWRILLPSGSVMLATSRREAEQIANIVNDELTHLAKALEADTDRLMIHAHTVGMNPASLYCCDRCQEYKERGFTRG